MESLVNRSRTIAGWEVPWFVALTTYHSEADASDEEFRQAQRDSTKIKKVYLGADTDQLRAEYRDGVHFNARGLRAHAELWNEALRSSGL
jgi:lysophospholipase L1-like esterase